MFADDPQRFPGAPRRRCTAASLVETLWREGRAPRWIDLVVIAVEDGRAVIRANASARFTADPAVQRRTGWAPHRLLHKGLAKSASYCIEQ